MLVLTFAPFWLAGVGLFAYLGLLVAAGMFAWQIVTLDINDAISASHCSSRTTASA
jgi:4-hydroxybenzoate polyprenyltransferase